jgi:hypothetical protein
MTPWKAWPSGLQRANLGLGLYTWATSEDAERYAAHLLKREAVALVVVVYEIAEDELERLKKQDLTQLSDEDANAWLNKYSEYGDAEPHDWDYIIRNTGMGTEHYFASHVFNRLREVK